MAGSTSEIEKTIRERLEDIQNWISDEAPYIVADQRHLDANTPERAYWHFGYQAALRDILKLVETSKQGSAGTSK
jgi:hypothetical protein